jgi:Raf kinase inhibitor-like YbhB/YbcL family protein
MGTFVHWLIYNLSTSIKGLPEGVSTSALAAEGEQGLNGRNAIGYIGPCPPPGNAHHYHLRLFALDRKLDLKPGATAQEVEAAMKGHVLGSTELIGIFER